MDLHITNRMPVRKPRATGMHANEGLICKFMPIAIDQNKARNKYAYLDMLG